MSPTRLRLQAGGDADADDVLVLLHGMGATGDVWKNLTALLVARQWPGRWIAPDLPGHGGSDPLAAYDFAAFASSIADALQPLLAGARRVSVLGHSLGGAIALALATHRFGLAPTTACGVGIKIAWSADDLSRAQALASKPNPIYPTRAEAVDRHLKLAGLTGLVAPETVADAATRRVGDGWSAAFDPRAFGVGAPDIARWIADARARLVLAAGEHDAMGDATVLRDAWPAAVVLPGLGHNAHVENAAAVWSLLADGPG